DSGAGTITHTYDLLDRLTQEQTPEGTITYTYDAASRRATAQVGLIRFGGHLLKGSYDVHNGRNETPAASPAV
ncbi:MAG: hypothetical protein WBC51_07770, partial [Vicinamibacterales bacterium]